MLDTILNNHDSVLAVRFHLGGLWTLHQVQLDEYFSQLLSFFAENGQFEQIGGCNQYLDLPDVLVSD